MFQLLVIQMNAWWHHCAKWFVCNYVNQPEHVLHIANLDHLYCFTGGRLHHACVGQATVPADFFCDFSTQTSRVGLRILHAVWEGSNRYDLLCFQHGDTTLHVAVRGRSKRITEALLCNPKDRRLLYKPNKAGETPYQVDASHQKSILTQVSGNRK